MEYAVPPDFTFAKAKVHSLSDNGGAVVDYLGNTESPTPLGDDFNSYSQDLHQPSILCADNTVYYFPSLRFYFTL